MNIKGRRALYISAILVFLAIAPVLLLYAQGYRYDLNTRSIVHIGAISVDSVPPDASIAIDGADARRTTPTLIGNTYPGTYHVVLTKQGYQPWSIDTTVAPSNTSRLNATLLPSTLSGHYTTDVDITAVTPTSIDRKIAVAYRSSDIMTIEVFSFDAAATTTIARYAIDSTDSVQLLWSPRGKYLAALRTGKTLRIIDPSVPHEIFADSTKRLTDVIWNPANENIMYAIGDGSLWEVDLLNRTTNVIASPRIIAAAFDGSALWMLRSNGAESTLERYNSSDPDKKQLTRTVPIASVSRMYIQSGRCVMVSPQAAYMFEMPEGPIAIIPVPGVETIQTGANRDEVLLSSTSEVWTLDLASADASLVMRQSNVQSSAWFPNRDVILVLSKDTVRMYDTVLRTVQAGQLGPFDRARSIIVVDDTTIAVVSASSIDVISY